MHICTGTGIISYCMVPISVILPPFLYVFFTSFCGLLPFLYVFFTPFCDLPPSLYVFFTPSDTVDRQVIQALGGLGYLFYLERRLASIATAGLVSVGAITAVYGVFSRRWRSCFMFWLEDGLGSLCFICSVDLVEFLLCFVFDIVWCGLCLVLNMFSVDCV